MQSAVCRVQYAGCSIQYAATVLPTCYLEQAFPWGTQLHWKPVGIRISAGDFKLCSVQCSVPSVYCEVCSGLSSVGRVRCSVCSVER